MAAATAVTRASTSLRRAMSQISLAKSCSTLQRPSSSSSMVLRAMSTRTGLPDGPDLSHFLRKNQKPPRVVKREEVHGKTAPYLQAKDIRLDGSRVYFETYGCQMNVNDTEIAWAILQEAGCEQVDSLEKADIIMAVTCAIRENAERKVWQRLDVFKKHKMATKDRNVQIGVLGCMAERLKTKLLERDKLVDIIAGPDAYRDLPRMLADSQSDGQAQVNVILSLDETYGGVTPVRLSKSSPSAFVSIQRGCDNMCAFCIVPFTRGRERSRPVEDVVEEVRHLSEQGIREVTLLGQNVNSYRDTSELKFADGSTVNSKGFATIYKPKAGGRRFHHLLESVAAVDPNMRIRFTSPHPKDFPDDLLYVIRDNHNICNQLHMPAQSGSTDVLMRMRRNHSKEAYLDLVQHIREVLPGVTLSSDFIAGFCGETEEDHQHTVDLMRRVRYDMAYMFAYSMRERTHAHHRYTDDVPEETKIRRLNELISTFHEGATEANKEREGKVHMVLVDGPSKRNPDELVGRTDGNVKIIFPKKAVDDVSGGTTVPERGSYVEVLATSSTSMTLRGEAQRVTTLERQRDQPLQAV